VVAATVVSVTQLNGNLPARRSFTSGPGHGVAAVGLSTGSSSRGSVIVEDMANALGMVIAQHVQDLLVENIEAGFRAAIAFYRARTINRAHAAPSIREGAFRNGDREWD